MTILFATTGYVRKGKPKTGLPAYLYRVSQALLGMGHVPIILTLGLYDFYQKDDGIEVYTVYAPRIACKNKCVGFIGDALRASWSVNKKIKELSQKRKIDII